MDSVTQFALGAAIGESVLGRKAGVRAALIGGMLASVPDLDVLYPYASDVSAFTWHRGVSHSLFVLALCAPLLAWLLQKLPVTNRGTARDWRLLVFLALLTHPLLDAFTVYGTQLFWPLPVPPVAWSTLFIIDPLVTTPLLAGIIGARIAHRYRTRHADTINLVGIILAVAYLGVSVAIKQSVEQTARDILAARGIEYARLLSTPLPFGTSNWRLVAMTRDGYLQGLHRLGGDMRFESFPSQPEYLDGLPAQADIERLKWFSRGFFSVHKEGTRIIYSDLRMGIEPDYVFSFDVGPGLSEPRQRPMPFDFASVLSD